MAEQSEITADWKAVDMTDRHAAASAGVQLAVPDITGPRQQEILARVFAAHRIAARERAIEECAKVADVASGQWEAWPPMWCLGTAIAADIRSLNTPPKLKEA